MPTFQYKARSFDGSPVSGIIQAYDEFEAVEQIRQNCSVVTRIDLVESLPKESADLFASRKISEQALSLVCSQFRTIIAAGLPIMRCVELVAGQTADRRLKKLLLQVAEDVAAGHSLAQSFENKGRAILPQTFIETVRAGEESGALDETFGRLYRYYDSASKIRAKIVSAMAYPLFLCGVAAIVVMVIMLVAVPMFTATFADMGIDLPLITRALIGASDFLSNYFFLLLGVLIVLFICLKYYSVTERGRLAFARLRLRTPLLGKLAVMRAASQFANTLSTLLAAGLPMMRAIAITGRTMSNYLLGTQAGKTVAGVEEGRRLSDCLKDCPFFPPLLIEMTGVGEESGALERTLEDTGAYFDNEMELLTARVLSLLEPVIIFALAIIVVIILLAVYLPMFTMYGNI